MFKTETIHLVGELPTNPYAELSLNALLTEIIDLENYFEMCERHEQGISTKDQVKMRELREEWDSRR